MHVQLLPILNFHSKSNCSDRYAVVCRVLYTRDVAFSELFKSGDLELCPKICVENWRPSYYCPGRIPAISSLFLTLFELVTRTVEKANGKGPYFRPIRTIALRYGSITLHYTDSSVCRLMTNNKSLFLLTYRYV